MLTCCQDHRNARRQTSQANRRWVVVALGSSIVLAVSLYVVGTYLGRQRHQPEPPRTLTHTFTLCQLRVPHASLAPAARRGADELAFGTRQPRLNSPENSLIRQCQACGPLSPEARFGVECASSAACCQPGWSAQEPIPWQALVQGEYVGPPRTPHVPQYLVRPGDQIEFLYRRKREMSSAPYTLNVGDTIRVESMTDEKLNRDLIIQLDGTITLAHALEVRAAGRTVEELTKEIEERYKRLYKVPAITVTPVDTERRLQDLLSAVDSRFGAGGLSQQTTVTPEGTIQLPGIGNVLVIGLTIDEIEREVEQRYAQVVLGIGVTPRLTQIAPRFVYVGGEVRNPNRYTLESPTTAIMAIAMAGGWNYGGNLRQIVIFRRTDDWRLVATTLDLRNALLGRQPCPADEIWLRDSDIVYVPKGRLLLTDNVIELFFTQGLYRIIPINVSFASNSTL